MNKLQFQQATGLDAETATLWFPHIIAAMQEFDISQPVAQAMFIAQVGHESRGFKKLVESLNYTPAGLQQTFSKKRFPDALASQLGRTDTHPARQQEIAEIAYGNRMGNSVAGDGWKYRGRGLIHVSGLNNYRACGGALGLDLLLVPQLLEIPQYATRSAGWFWNARGCNPIAADIVRTTELVNGPAKAGLADRQRLFDLACKYLNVAVGDDGR